MEKDLTNEEMEVLRLYKKFSYKAINQLLTSDAETDIALLSEEENEEQIVSYDKMSVIKNLETIRNIYALILKISYKNLKKQNWSFSRGTSFDEVSRLKNEVYIDRILSATKEREIAINKYASKCKIPAIVNIFGDADIPYIEVNQILGDSNNEEEILISPFTKIKKIQDEGEIEIENGKVAKEYSVYLEKQELEEMKGAEREGLYTYIITNADLVNEKLQNCIEIEKENNENYENIRKLEQLLNKYEAELEKKEEEDTLQEDKEVDISNINRVNQELDNLKQLASELFKTRKEESNFITNWKRNVAVYVMAECKKLEEKYGIEKKVVEEMKSEKIEQIEKEMKQKYENLNEENLENIILAVKEECKENITASEKLKEEIKNLIIKQQNHAKIAGNLGTTYSALNNAFEMKKVTENLENLLRTIKLKVEELCSTENRITLDQKLLEISKVNIQINTLMNYLNNPKSAVGKAKITRFDEMAIIEENELKRGIAQEILNIRGEAELKKLKDDIEIIQEKTTLQRIIGILTGRNKIDEFMLEQIEVRQRAIRKTLSRKLELAKNYSIHELVAEIEMFARDNEEDELVEDDIADLENLEEELRRSFVILDSKVEEIIETKEAKNLPVEYKKITKQKLIEIETYRFLNKYGYDIEEEFNEPEYQDTMASEINRIIEYIESAKIL